MQTRFVIVVSIVFVAALILGGYFFFQTGKKASKTTDRVNTPPSQQQTDNVVPIASSRMLFGKIDQSDAGSFLGTASEESYTADVVAFDGAELTPLTTIEGRWPMVENDGWLYFSDEPLAPGTVNDDPFHPAPRIRGIYRQNIASGERETVLTDPSYRYYLLASVGDVVLIGDILMPEKTNGAFFYNLRTGERHYLTPTVSTVSATVADNGTMLLTGSEGQGSEQKLYVGTFGQAVVTASPLPEQAIRCSIVSLAPNGKTAQLTCQFQLSGENTMQDGSILVTINGDRLTEESRWISAVTLVDSQWMDDQTLVTVERNDEQQDVTVNVLTVQNGHVEEKRVIGNDQDIIVEDAVEIIPEFSYHGIGSVIREGAGHVIVQAFAATGIPDAAGIAQSAYWRIGLDGTKTKLFESNLEEEKSYIDYVGF